MNTVKKLLEMYIVSTLPLIYCLPGGNSIALQISIKSNNFKNINFSHRTQQSRIDGGVASRSCYFCDGSGLQ